MQIDEWYMKRCFELAKLGNGFVAPNPLVGAVLVYENTIIGEGYHQEYGKPHAEVNCINSVNANDKYKIEKSTLYVSLEPCSHYGKTPPCVDFIIKHKIKKVVIAVLDPNPLVAGNGIKKLKENGIETITSILEEEGKELIQKFYPYHHQKKIYITLKYAESADGYISKEKERIKISNPMCDVFVHQLRASHQAILIGKNTLDIDNPQLDVRLVDGKNPIKIILASDGNIDTNYALFGDKQTPIIIVNKNIEKKDDNIEWLKVNDVYNIQEVLTVLYQKNIQSILVEGGKKILDSFIHQNKWNAITRIIGNTEIKSGTPAPKLHLLKTSEQKIQDNIIINYTNNTY